MNCLKYTATLMNIFCTFLTSYKYNMLEDPSAVDSTTLMPAKKLEWNISPELARDIENAKKNVDK